ncbi:MAG: ABC-F family ATP-binding cassette domain-containing protein [Deltaproteobacteria bacterium]|nr:ABC-F family ATP-binding cassette domain-containing protein [Deltaproteobacteria bacterium]
MLAQLADVHFGYPGTELFESLSFQVNPGQRIGLVGPNGAGKSTLLRLLAGDLVPDRGQVVRARGKDVAYLHQSQEFHGQGTLWDTLLLPFAHLLKLREEIASLHDQIAALSHDEADSDRGQALLRRYGDLEHEYAHHDGYTLEVRAKALSHELGFADSDLHRPVATLSGGERGRVELAKVLLALPDLLLLDEPTNHLDVDAVEHLEERLMGWDATRAFVIVSHDRYFLQAVCNEIVEVEDGDVVRYPGSYEKYLVARQQRHEQLNAAWQRQQDEIARTEDFIRRNLAGQKTNQAKSRRKMLDKVDRLARHRDAWAEAGEIGLRFAVSDHRGAKEAIRTEHLELGFGSDPPLLRDFSTTLYRGERVGIIGPNGAGKTTLLKALIGRGPLRSGQVFVGPEVRIGYFDQKLSDLADEHSLIDEIRSIRGDWNEDKTRSYLGRFRFTGEDGFKKVRGLSGGERNRLQLAKLMLRPVNLLVMDEPTNHLDIPARETLEEALCAFDGTLLVVSHDRYFLDRVVTKLLHIDPQTASIDIHLGNYSDWKRRLAEDQRAVAEAAEAARAAQAKAQQAKASQRPAAVKPVVPDDASDKTKRMAEYEAKKDRERQRDRKVRRLGQVEVEIATLEARLKELRERLSAEHGGDWQQLHKLVDEEHTADRKLHALLGEWEQLSSELS